MGSDPAWRLHISKEELEMHLELLTKLELLDVKKETIILRNWEEEQYTQEQKEQIRHRDRREEMGLPRNRWINPKVKAYVALRDAYGCRNCGSKANLTIDHIIPEMQGGGNDADNLQLLCRSCNARKRDFPNDFLKLKSPKPISQPINQNPSTHKAPHKAPISTDTDTDTDTDTEEDTDSESDGALTSVQLLCETLNELVLQDDSNFKPDDWKSWIEEMGKILKDGRPQDEVDAVIRFSRIETFWRGVIFNPKVLRKHYPKLLVQMRESEGKGKKIAPVGGGNGGGPGRSQDRYDANMAAIHDSIREAEEDEGDGGAQDDQQGAGYAGDSAAGQEDQPGVHKNLSGHARRPARRGAADGDAGVLTPLPIFSDDRGAARKGRPDPADAQPEPAKID